MRFSFAAVLLALLGLFPLSASAGTVSYVNGQPVWQSTMCPVPAKPPSLAAINAETRAEDMNALITQYNQYVQVTQTYMNCVSAEAQHDGEAANETIVRSGQAVIADIQKNVTIMGSALQGAK